MHLYREIAVWKRVNDSLAVRYQLIEDLGERKFTIQSADFFRPSTTYNAILELEKQFAERLMDNPRDRDWHESIERAIEAFDTAFADLGDNTSHFALEKPMTLSTPIPVLRMFDEAKAREFYCDFLGFTVDWEHRFEEGTPLYMQIRSGDCIIQLSEHFGDACPGSSMRIRNDDLDVFVAELNARRYKNARPGIMEQPWARDCVIGDPFGNKLIFWAPHKPAEMQV